MPSKKPKEKILFTIPWTKKYKTSLTPRLLRRIGLFLLGAVIFLSIAHGSGALAYSYGFVKCLGKPVQTSDFMYTRKITMPSEQGYVISPMNSYIFCSPKEAEAAGYKTAATIQEDKEKAERDAIEREEARKEAEKFATSKVDYVVYLPVLEGYEVTGLKLSEINGTNHTFMDIRKNGKFVGEIREVPVDNKYNICRDEGDLNDRTCPIIGNDNSGREIRRYFSRGLARGSNSTSINIDGTGIILSGKDDAEAIKILSSLEPYVEN